MIINYPAEIMTHHYLLLLLLSFIFLLITVRRRRQRQPPLNLPPGPPPLPIIGNLHNLSKIPHIAFHRLSQKYGPIIQIYLGQVPTVIISDANTAADVLKSQDHIFCTRSQMAALKRFTYGGRDLAFSPYDDHWKQLRRLCNTEVFSLGRVRSFHSIRGEEVDALINTISSASSRNQAVNLSEMVLCFFNNVIFREVFGQRISAEGECELSPLQDLLREVMGVMVEFGTEDMFPSMGWIDGLNGWRGKLDKIFGKIDFLLEEKIRERVKVRSEGRRGENEGHEDFLDVLLHLQAKEDGASLSFSQVKAVLFNMFTGGTDTSAATIEWGMTHLMKNPEVLNKAQEEVRRIMNGKEKVEENDLQHMHYLRQVIKETLRLNPPTPLLPPRECMKDTKINDYNIQAKTRVYVNIWSVGRDPAYWDDPEVFQPERFMKNLINFKGNNFELIPFGSGRRVCPGITLAMASIELVLANLLYEFDWKLPDGMTEDDIDMTAATGIVTPKKVPLILVATPALKK